ncbi:MAG: ABC transporter ATP-binding protein, partial [Anaerolineales bacterium]|nr:ABC transporter ATP-binding protein [Anaerolineales bacterium]
MIEVNALSFTYRGARAPALHGLDFGVQPGEIFGFLGPSGAGKSTTQKILTRLLSGYAGQVRVFGRDLAAWGSDYYERIGVSFELPNHFLKLTARENLTYFGRLYRRQPHTPAEMLAQVGLADAADVPVGQFSKGMKNRLTLARALLHDPALLFLDEPTAGLDPASARRIRDLIAAQRAAGKTIFLTTHDMAVAEALCDRVAFLVHGRIPLIDTPGALKLRYGRPQVQVAYRANGDVARQAFPLQDLGHNAAFLQLLQTHPVHTMHTQEA